MRGDAVNAEAVKRILRESGRLLSGCTDSDIRDLVDEINAPLRNWSEDEEMTKGFYEGVKYKAYLENPGRVTHDDILRVLANIRAKDDCPQCMCCKNIGSRMFGYGHSECLQCSRYIHPSDRFEADGETGRLMAVEDVE